MKKKLKTENGTVAYLCKRVVVIGLFDRLYRYRKVKQLTCFDKL